MKGDKGMLVVTVSQAGVLAEEAGIGVDRVCDGDVVENIWAATFPNLSAGDWMDWNVVLLLAGFVRQSPWEDHAGYWTADVIQMPKR